MRLVILPESNPPMLAALLLYHQLPSHFIWIPKDKKCPLRKRGGEKSIGSLISCSQLDFERYYLRTLLCYTIGPKSFIDIRTFNEVVDLLLLSGSSSKNKAAEF